MKYLLLKAGINSNEFVLFDVLVIPDNNIIKAGFAWGREVLREQVYPLFDLNNVPKYSVKIPLAMQQLKEPALFNHLETELIFPLISIGETNEQRNEISSLDPSFEQSQRSSNMGNRTHRRTSNDSRTNLDDRENSPRDHRKRRQAISNASPSI